MIRRTITLLILTILLANVTIANLNQPVNNNIDKKTLSCVTPRTNMVILNNTTFCKGVYNSKNIQIAADGITVDCNGATLMNGQIGFRVGSRNNIVLKNCILKIEGYYV